MRSYKELIQHENAFASTLVTMLVDIFGTECFQWTPQTILLELEQTIGAVPSQLNIDRMMAGVCLMTSNTFYTSLPDFNDLCVVVSGEPATPGTFVPADAASIAWGITEALFLSPPDDLNSAFTEDIRAFIGAVLKDEGILTPPDVLRIAHMDKDIVKKVNYDYSDDTEMFSSIYQVEKSKSDDINKFVRNRLEDMIMQLQELPLKNGNAESVATNLLRELPEPTADAPLP